jgi:hypothetical protein
MDSTLVEQVHAIIKEHYRDQKVVELETTQAIASRLSDWAKLFGFFVGIPIAALLLILGALGIKTYSDFSSQVAKTQKDVSKDLEDARTDAAKLKTDGLSLAAEYGTLRAQFADTKALAEQVKGLSEKVDFIGEKLGLALGTYQQYLEALGYRGTGTVSLEIDSTMESGLLSYYDPDRRKIVVSRKFAEDPIVVYREYSHHVLFSSGIPNDPNSAYWLYYAIESGLAWYFPCSFVNNPKPTTAATWDLSRKRRFGDLKPDTGSAIIDGTEIWGSAFWELRLTLGQMVADKLLFDTWFKLRPEEVQSDRGASFVRKLLDANPSVQAQIRTIFTERGLAL